MYIISSLLISSAINIMFAILLAYASTNHFSYVSPTDSWLPYLHNRLARGDAPVAGVAMFVAINVAATLIIKVYLALVLGKATPQEQQTGLAGVRAWLSPAKVAAVLLGAIAGYVGFEIGLFNLILAGFGLLMIVPAVTTFSVPRPSEESAQAPPADESQRVLTLVERGQISVEDGKELLSALAQSHAASPATSSSVLSVPRRLVVGGAALMLVAFLLPWFTVNAAQAMADMVNGMQQAMPRIDMATPPNQSFMQTPVQSIMHLTLRGGDVRNGLGWIALAGAAVVAGLPYFVAAHATDPRLRNVAIGSLIVGSIALLYLLTNSFNAITTIEPGFILAFVSYLLLWAGTVRRPVGLSSAGIVNLASA